MKVLALCAFGIVLGVVLLHFIGWTQPGCGRQINGGAEWGC